MSVPGAQQPSGERAWAVGLAVYHFMGDPLARILGSMGDRLVDLQIKIQIFIPAAGLDTASPGDMFCLHAPRVRQTQTISRIIQVK